VSRSKREQAHLDGFIPEPEHARELGITVETLQKKRRRGETCAYVTIGRMVHYSIADRERWLKAQLVRPPRSGQAAA